MSTILQALQKRKLAQAGGPAPITLQANETSSWKTFISVVLLIIMVLLSILIYLLLNPRSASPTAPQKNTEVAQTNNVVKVVFETQPLPTPVAKAKKIVAVKVEKIILAQKEQTTVKTTKIKELPPIAITNEKIIDYGNATSELAERFKLAVLLADLEQNDNMMDDITAEELSDGSNIREMSSNFQDKVPLIRYDSHVYSSIATERWIRINDEVLREGDLDSTGQLKLIEIQPQRSVFRLGRQSFSIESLQDWEGY